RRVRVFSPEAQLLHLAAHLELHHAGAGWLWVYDIAALIHKFGGAMDWEVIVDTAVRFEWGQSLRVALERAQAVFGVAVPESATARWADLRATRSERLARVLAEPTAHQAAFLFDGLNQRDWRARVRYLWRALFPSPEFMRIHGPIRNRRDLAWQYLLRLGRGLYRIPRALWSGVNEYRTNKRI
ncbi:MAG: nucleotidyltransferase family protein, partial [Chloroflexota bacterium]